MRNLELVSKNFCLWPEAVQKEFIQKGVLKICPEFTGGQQRSITMLLKWHFKIVFSCKFAAYFCIFQ